MTTYCGTGSGNFPQPGDPDFNGVVISAAAAFGGIDVAWTYPGLNPHSVAHFILYRSMNPDPATMIRHRVVTGDFYYDRVDADVTYYYWIQTYSVNETYGDILGPASAQARPTIEQVIDMLSGQITDGQLGSALRNEITRISSLDQDLSAEAAARIQADDSLGAAFAQNQADVEAVSTLINNEVQARQEADSATITSLNQNYTELVEERALRVAAIQQEIEDRKAAVLGEATSRQAAIQQEIDDRIAAVSAERDARVLALVAEQGDRAAAIDAEKTERVNADTALSNQLTTLTSVVDTNSADISSEQTARASGDSALAQDITTLQTQTGNNTAAIVNESETRTSAYNSIALNQAVAAAAFQGNSSSLMVLEESRASDKEAFASQLVSLSASIDDNEATILEEKTVRSTAIEAVTNELNVLSAKLDALPTFSNDLEDGDQYSAWTVAAGETLDPEMTVAYTGDQAGLVTSTATSPALGGAPQVVAVALPSGTAGTLAGYKVRVTLAIKAPDTGAATEIALAYQAGNQHSGWHYFTPTGSWQVVEFTYIIPEVETADHYFLVWGDTSGAGLGVLIDRVLVQVAEAEISQISSAISEERDARVAEDEALASQIVSLDSQLDTVNASITTEAQTRAAEDAALSQRITTMQGEVDGNEAAITEEASLRVTAVNAVASDLQALSTTVDGNTADISSESLTRSNADTALGQRIDTVSADTASNSVDITSETTARTNADTALGERIDLVITDVDGNTSAIATEQTARSDADSALAQDITVLTAATQDNASSINQEASTRSDDDEAQALVQKVLSASSKLSSGVNRTREVVRVNDDLALSQRIDFLGSQFDDNAAYIQTVETTMADADSALASQLTTLSSTVDDNQATLLQDYETAVDAESARASLKTGIQTDYEGHVATVLQDYETASDSGSARATLKTTLEATMSTKDSAAIQDNNRAMIGYCMVDGSIDSSQETPEACDLAGGEWLPATPLAESVKGVQVTDNDGDSANVEQRMVTYKDELGVLNSEYTAKVQVDPTTGETVVGGFGLAANGETGMVEAGFDVDRFWVGKLGSKRYPFIVDTNGEVFMNEAVINKLTFTKLRSDDGSLIFNPTTKKLELTYLDVDNLVAKNAESDNYIPGSQGWSFNADGSAEMHGHVVMQSGAIADSVTIGGIGDLAYKSSLGYNEVTGTKPATDADNTATHTAYDTNRVSGSYASTVRSWALDGYYAGTKTDDWVKPGRTEIDGNKIFTGDAYVDTLQIKGQAVTVPVASNGAGSAGGNKTWGANIASFTYNHGDSATLPVVFTAHVIGEASYVANMTNYDDVWRFRLVVNGSVRYTSPWIGPGVGTGTCTVKYWMPSGNRSVYVDAEQAGYSSGGIYSSSLDVTISAIGCKR